MADSILKYFSVYLGSMLKFILGPTLGIGEQLSYWETVLLTIAGSMTTVIFLSFIGEPARVYLINKLSRKRRVFSKRNRRIIKIWSRTGIRGVAFLMPLVLTPPGGTFVALLFGVPRRKIIKYMFLSAAFWSMAITFIIYEFALVLGYR